MTKERPGRGALLFWEAGLLSWSGRFPDPAAQPRRKGRWRQHLREAFERIEPAHQRPDRSEHRRLGKAPRLASPIFEDAVWRQAEALRRRVVVTQQHFVMQAIAALKLTRADLQSWAQSQGIQMPQFAQYYGLLRTNF